MGMVMDSGSAAQPVLGVFPMKKLLTTAAVLTLLVGTTTARAAVDKTLMGLAVMGIYVTVCGEDVLTRAALLRWAELALQYSEHDRAIATERAKVIVANFGTVGQMCSNPTIKEIILQFNIDTAK
jgi:hypothetical protein